MAEMKAMRYKESNLQKITVPIPQCGDEDVLIEVKSCLLDRKTPGDHIGGSNFGGIVKECGQSITDIKPGDHVVVDSAVPCGRCYACRRGEVNNCEHVIYYGADMDGGYAQFVTVDERAVYKISDNLDFDKAIFARRVANIYAAFSKIENKSGYSMLIVGSGVDAQIAHQMAKKSSAGKVKCVEDNLSFEEIKEKGGPADVVVNLSTDNELTFHLLDLVIPGGSMLLLGKSEGKTTLEFGDARDFFFHIANIITSNPKAGYFIDGLNYIEEKIIDVSDFCGNTVSYRQVNDEISCADGQSIILHPND